MFKRLGIKSRVNHQAVPRYDKLVIRASVLVRLGHQGIKFCFCVFPLVLMVCRKEGWYHAVWIGLDHISVFLDSFLEWIKSSPIRSHQINFTIIYIFNQNMFIDSSIRIDWQKHSGKIFRFIPLTKPELLAVFLGSDPLDAVLGAEV